MCRRRRHCRRRCRRDGGGGGGVRRLQEEYYARGQCREAEKETERRSVKTEADGNAAAVNVYRFPRGDDKR